MAQPGRRHRQRLRGAKGLVQHDMTRAVRRQLLGAMAALALGVAAPDARGKAALDSPTAGDALLRQLGFSAGDLARIAAGEVIGHTLPADGSEVALAVATTMRVTPAFYLDRLREIVSFKRTEEVLQIGTVSARPTTADFASLTFELDDVEDLRSCRLDQCGVKLDQAGIERLARADADIPSASAGLREYLALYSARYLTQGNAALIEYRDDRPPRPLLADLQEILRRSAYLEQGWPELTRAVAQFAGTLPPGLEGFLYWSKEKVGPRAVVSMTHVVMSPIRDGRAAVATKQVYASHYSDASLGLTMLFERASGAEPRTLVIYTNRTRLDVFGGILGGLKRPIVRSRARDGATRTMGRLSQRMDRQFRAAHD
jgi:hypothetical protein